MFQKFFYPQAISEGNQINQNNGAFIPEVQIGTFKILNINLEFRLNHQ